MVKLGRQEDIQQFLSSTGLDVEDRAESLEAWRLKWEGLAKGFMNYLQERFASIERRLDRLEQLEEERYGHQEA